MWLVEEVLTSLGLFLIMRMEISGFLWEMLLGKGPEGPDLNPSAWLLSGPLQAMIDIGITEYLVC